MGLSLRLLFRSAGFVRLAAALTVSAFAGRAGEAKEIVHGSRSGILLVEEVKPHADRSTMEAWARDWFEGDEVWFLEDLVPFLSHLRIGGVPQELLRGLLENARTTLTLDELARTAALYNAYDGRRVAAVVFVPAELKDRFTKDQLFAVYRYLLSLDYSPSQKKFTSREDAENFFAHHSLRRTAFAKIWRQFFFIRGHYRLFLTPDLWSVLDEGLKIELLNGLIEEGGVDTGLEVNLHFTGTDDLNLIARRYAGERDPAVVERYLRRLLSRSRDGSVTIPLQKVLHPYIRETLNTYSRCWGPNCFSASLNVNAGHAYAREHIPNGERFLQLVHGRYRYVQPDEQLHTGDLLMYRDKSGQVVHVSVFITDEIVYSKNGLEKIRPFQFEYRERNEALYFPDGRFKMVAFRLAKPDEFPIARQTRRLWGRNSEVTYLDTASFLSRSGLRKLGRDLSGACAWLLGSRISDGP